MFCVHSGGIAKGLGGGKYVATASVCACVARMI